VDVQLCCDVSWSRDVHTAVTSSLNESLTLLLGNDSVVSNVTAAAGRKTSPTDEYFR